ncbi:MAG: DNA polymerase III subunit gamma/tau [Gammaproteobacteria bacterium]|nr:MAG: DNA polymerase III subunit gamma/tau [Gammaproteobacteria bacterium]
MEYQALARKWRPHTFDELIGQDFIVRAIRSSLKNNRLHHAYLFSGTRGVGKTTIARIFAKSLNCDKGVSEVACGKCPSCIGIDNGSSVDLIEVDAASRRTVEQTASLLDNVAYKPASSRFKIYIIDEVHMFSKHSFNALLKTLEEPPPHIKFLLATTDPRKLPITILSRCLQFNLKSIGGSVISTHMAKILKKEQIEFEEDALDIIGKAADGSVRDALSLLDQSISFGNGAVKKEQVIDMLGIVSSDMILNIIELVIKNDANQAYEILENINQQHSDAIVIVDELLELLYAISLYQTTKIINNKQHLEQIQNIIKIATPAQIQLLYQIVLQGKQDIKFAPDESYGLQMILLRMLAFAPTPTLANPVINNAPPATTSAPIPNVNNNTNNQITTNHQPPQQITQPQTQQPTQPSLTEKPKQDLKNLNWNALSSGLNLSGFAKQLAVNCSLSSVENNTIKLQLSPDNNFLLTDNNCDKLEQAINMAITEDIKIKIDLMQPVQITPQAKEEQIQNQADSKQKQDFINQPVVQNIQQEFGIKVDENSVTLEKPN